MRRQMMISRMSDPIFRQKILNPKKPTRPERDLGKNLPTVVRYVGNGKWWCRFLDGKYKNPDFKVTGQRIVIEVFGDWWHRNDDPDLLISAYRRIGYKCLVIWERDITKDVIGAARRVVEFISNG